MKKIALFTFVFILLSATYAAPGYLGVVINDFTSGQVSGVLVTEVFENSAAWEQGLKEADIITAINGKTVHNSSELAALLSTYHLGDKVEVSFMRNGNDNTENIILGIRPEQITVQVSRELKEDGEHWYFSEDGIDIVVNDSNKPVSITRTDKNGHLKVIKKLKGFDVKLGYIKRMKSDLQKCDCHCVISQYTFYSIPKENKKEEVRVVSDLPVTERFEVTPNPTKGRIRVDISSNENGPKSLMIFDVNGKAVQTDILPNFSGEYSKEYHLESLARGEYMVQLQIGDKQTTRKIILQ